MAHIKKHHSLIRAEQVLRAVNRIGVPKEIAERVYAETWDNCREQGLSLRAMTWDKGEKPRWVTVYIAECRNSDETVVVVDSNSGGFTRAPSDEAWEFNRKYFPETKVKAAAKFIVQALKAEVQ